MTLAIPPLRERRADVPLLFSYFIEKPRNGSTVRSQVS
jgi:transcriptional regulator with GAF, ATPase, and Fis domain